MDVPFSGPTIFSAPELKRWMSLFRAHFPHHHGLQLSFAFFPVPGKLPFSSF